VKFDVRFHTEECVGEPWTSTFDEPKVHNMYEANKHMKKWLDIFNALVDNESRRRILTIHMEENDETLVG